MEEDGLWGRGARGFIEDEGGRPRGGFIETIGCVCFQLRKRGISSNDPPIASRHETPTAESIAHCN